MIENSCPAGMPGLMRDALYVRVRERKNCKSIMALAEWCFAHGMLYRHRKGFGLVRGSDRKLPTGLKERGDLQELGLTADKIRGAINALVEVAFIDKRVPSGTWRPNLRGEARNPAAVYRLSAEFRAIYVRARETGLEILKKAGVAAKAVAQKLCQSVTTNLRLSEALLPSPPNSRFADQATSSGDFGSKVHPDGPESRLGAPPKPVTPMAGHGQHDDRMNPEGPPERSQADPPELDVFDQIAARYGLSARRGST